MRGFDSVVVEGSDADGKTEEEKKKEKEKRNNDDDDFWTECLGEAACDICCDFFCWPRRRNNHLDNQPNNSGSCCKCCDCDRESGGDEGCCGECGSD